MTKDLEETLATLGPAYGDVVGRLARAAEIAPRGAGGIPCRCAWRRPALLAASLAVLVGGTVLFGLRTPGARPLPAGPREYALARARTPAAIAELVRTQRADGGWANDFLTRQNAQALRTSADAAAQLAYRKAVRNLRMRGVADGTEAVCRGLPH